jgi:predicted membrane channel-forming protein YqfA (hemolysin III family)
MGVIVFALWESLSPTGWIAVLTFVLGGAVLYVGTIFFISKHFRATVSGILDDFGVQTPL